MATVTIDYMGMTAAAAEYQRLTGCGWSATLPAQP
jgi:hypothetical protein